MRLPLRMDSWAALASQNGINMRTPVRMGTTISALASLAPPCVFLCVFSVYLVLFFGKAAKLKIFANFLVAVNLAKLSQIISKKLHFCFAKVNLAKTFCSDS